MKLYSGMKMVIISVNSHHKNATIRTEAPKDETSGWNVGQCIIFQNIVLMIERSDAFWQHKESIAGDDEWGETNTWQHRQI